MGQDLGCLLRTLMQDNTDSVIGSGILQGKIISVQPIIVCVEERLVLAEENLRITETARNKAWKIGDTAILLAIRKTYALLDREHQHE